MSNLLVTTIGVGAALCSMASFIPQALKVVRARDASTVSLRMYVVTVVGFGLWTNYGVMLQSWPLMVSNFVSLCLSGLILASKFRYPDSSKATG